MIGLPLAPTYLPGIPTPQQPVLTTVPPIRQQLNRYRYAALSYTSFWEDIVFISFAIYKFFYA